MRLFRFAVIPAAVLAVPAYAGNLAEPAPQPVVAAPVPVQPLEEWTGFYIGGQVGYGDASVPGADYDGGLAGLHAGYMHDFGQWVLGGEVDYDWADLSGPGGKVDEIGRLKVLGGYDLGQGLIYATAGAFNANFSGTAGDTDDDGAFIGLGYKHKFNENWVGGVEALYHEADDFGGASGNDLEATTITARISYQF